MPAKVSATVLVVEQNAAVLELIDQVLRELGHRVLSTRLVPEAIEVAGRVRIDVVVAGVLLEEGRQALICHLRSIQPDVHVIICNPNGEGETIDRVTLLSGPLSLGDLRDAVAGAIDQGRSLKSP